MWGTEPKWTKLKKFEKVSNLENKISENNTHCFLAKLALGHQQRTRDETSGTCPLWDPYIKTKKYIYKEKIHNQEKKETKSFYTKYSGKCSLHGPTPTKIGFSGYKQQGRNISDSYRKINIKTNMPVLCKATELLKSHFSCAVAASRKAFLVRHSYSAAWHHCYV